MNILGNNNPSAADQQNSNVAPTPTLSKYAHDVTLSIKNN